MGRKGSGLELEVRKEHESEWDRRFSYAGDLIGSLHAGRDGAAISLANAVIGVNTGRDAFVWAFDEFHNNIFSGRDAVVISLGDVNGGVFASGSGLVYAVEDAIGSVDAGEYAGVVTWGDAAGPMTVKGPDGAFGWSYGDFKGFVESTGGNAFLTAYGNGSGAVRGAGYAEVYTAGDWLGDVEGGDGAGGIALGNFGGNLTAGSNGYILSEGSINASLDAGRDAVAWAIGDVAGNFSAGRDAAAVAYGNYAADISADRDVVTVWARGALSGAITAGRNVGQSGGSTACDGGDVFSFGQIDVTVTALNPANLPNGGRVGCIAAWGSVAGTVDAANSIGGVRSGGGVTATLNAPTVPIPSAFDATLNTDHPYPDMPASAHDAVMAAIAGEYDLVIADKAQAAVDIALLLTDLATQRATALADVATARSDAAAGAVQAVTDVAAALAADVSVANAELDTARDAALAGWDSLAAEVAATETAIDDYVTELSNRRLASYAAALDLAAASQAKLAVADGLIDQEQRALNGRTTAVADQRAETWDSFVELLHSDLHYGWYHVPPPPPPPEPEPTRAMGGGALSDIPDVAVVMNHRSEQAAQAEELVVEFSRELPLASNAVAGYEAFSGTDIVGNKISGTQRIFSGLQAATAVIGVKAAVDEIGETGTRAAFQTTKGLKEVPTDDILKQARNSTRNAASKVDDLSPKGASSTVVRNVAGQDIRPMRIVREIRQGERIADIVDEAKVLTFTNDVEYALVKLADGRRVLVSGGRNGIQMDDVTRIFGHSHPYSLPVTGPSTGPLGDTGALECLGQIHSYLLEHGELIRFGVQ